jgi:hypothetical protein
MASDTMKKALFFIFVSFLLASEVMGEVPPPSVEPGV